MQHAGEIAALATAICWTITALAFESASRKVGSLAVNLTRLALAFVFLTLFNWITLGHFFPHGATTQQWIWLMVSGLAGFVLGDLFLFEAFTIIGARVSALIMTLVPVQVALAGWLFLHEKLELLSIAGILLTLAGIFIVILNREDGKSFHFAHSAKGLAFAFLGSVGQSTGLIFSKYGMQDFNPFMSTQIRIIAGFFGFALLIFFMGKWKNVGKAFRNKPAFKRIVFGSFFGPFLGVSLSLLSVQLTQTGVASTLMSMVPVFIIAPSVIFLGHKVSTREIIGALVSVAGVSLFFL